MPRKKAETTVQVVERPEIEDNDEPYSTPTWTQDVSPNIDLEFLYEWQQVKAAYSADKMAEKLKAGASSIRKPVEWDNKLYTVTAILGDVCEGWELCPHADYIKGALDHTVVPYTREGEEIVYLHDHYNLTKPVRFHKPQLEEASNSVPELEEISESVMESEDPQSIPQPEPTARVNHSEQLSLLPTKRPVFSYLDVSLSMLPPNETLGSPEPTKAFIESVAALGVLQPILLTRQSEPDGLYPLMAGIRRIKAARASHFTEIPAMVLMNPEDVDYREVLTLVENHQRKDNPIADIRAIKELMLRGAGEKEICEATGLTKSQLKRFEPLLHLHETLLDAMQSGAISPSVAIAAARRTRAEQEELVELYTENKKLNQKDVDEIRRVKRKAAFSYLPADMFEEEEPPTPQEPTWSEKMLFHLAAALGALVGVKPQSDAESTMIVSVGDRLRYLIDDLNAEDHGEE